MLVHLYMIVRRLKYQERKMLMLALAARKIPTEIVMDTLTVAKMWVAIKPDLYVSYIQP